MHRALMTSGSLRPVLAENGPKRGQDETFRIFGAESRLKIAVVPAPITAVGRQICAAAKGRPARNQRASIPSARTDAAEAAMHTSFELSDKHRVRQSESVMFCDQ